VRRQSYTNPRDNVVLACHLRTIATFSNLRFTNFTREQLLKSVKDFIETRQCDQWQQIERDAELFSLAIRIPASKIHEECSKAYEEVVSENGFQGTPLILRQVRNALANTYAVNYEDMNRRISRWPFDYLYDCITVSSIARSEKLLRPEMLAEANPDAKQKLLFGQ